MGNREKNLYFEGDERFGSFPFLGTLFRMGSPSALSVGDRARVLESARKRDLEKLKQYLEIVHFSHTGIATLFLEWALEWPSSFAASQGSEVERSCSRVAFDKWKQATDGLLKEPSSRRAIEMLSSLFTRECTVGHELLAAVVDGQKESLRQVRSGELQGFEEHFTRYWDFVRGMHDGIVQYIQCYPAAVREIAGQELAERMFHESFSRCSFYKMLWTFMQALDPAELAAFNGDHLRAHFSGKDGEGSVRIIEEPDRFRLIFDACGSGGAMRRRLAASGTPAEVFPDASPATWGLRNQVPPYCSHCALNELESIKRFGFPISVTEFDPDPSKPCGWTIYKDPKNIPDRYFERLGTKKDLSRYRKQSLKYRLIRFFGVTLGIKMKKPSALAER